MVQPNFIYISFSPFKNFFLLFPTSPYDRLAHTAHADLVLDFPFIIPLFLNIYPSSAKVVGFHHFILSRLQPMKYTPLVFRLSPFARSEEHTSELQSRV